MIQALSVLNAPDSSTTTKNEASKWLMNVQNQRFAWALSQALLRSQVCSQCYGM